MDKRFLLFLLIAFTALTINAFVANWLRPPQPPVEQPLAQGDGDKKAADPQDGDEPPKKVDPPADPGPPPVEEEPEDAGPATPAPAVEAEWIAIGSASPDSPYKMMAVLSNVGACIEQVELNDGTRDLEDIEDHSGYLGPLAAAAVEGGLKVNVVGPGTPTDLAGLKVGDVLTSFAGTALTKVEDLDNALDRTKVDDTVAIEFFRDGRAQPAARAKLTQKPLKVLSREVNTTNGELDQASFLLTMRQINDRSLQSDDTELKNVALLGSTWQIKNATPSSVEFVQTLPDDGLEIVKRYRLASAGEEADSNTPLYHLDLTVEIRNTKSKPAEVAYQLDGPTGLPTEGWWYANKQSRTWSGVGVRDIAIYNFDGPTLLSCVSVAEEQKPLVVDKQLRYLGVDAQYFSAVMLPRLAADQQPWLASGRTILAGPVPEDKNLKKLTNVSFRVSSQAETLSPKGGSLSHSYRIFLGPKKPDVIAPYGLDDLVYYGMFSPVSKFLLGIMHFCYHNLVFNYGLAIIMLTVMVRGAMFPLSRKQAIGAQKMQEIQPELKKLNEKYKGQQEQRQKATMELFRKHKYNPYGGCLVMFIQLPIFIGLYRALMVDVELRQAPLIPGMQWCSNLAAPDMLHRWANWQPFLTGYTSMLGPYFNLLPLFTVGLFLWQQKMFMPPPTDEQSAMQQKMMKYMMIFISLMFFKVPSGLCIYFIASSLWGIAERKLLPKSKPANGDITLLAPAKASTNGQNGSGGTRRKKQKGR
ncbi:MAG: YidC/Oxa1 family insertase periplasmic-domain containing protein [Pirellulales bacterium]